MPFDPKSYLAEKAAAQPQEFDPKAYLAEKTAPPSIASIAPQSGSSSNAAEAGLQGFGQGGTLGYLPEIQARAAQGAQAILPESWGGGGNETYDQLKKYFQNNDKQMKAEHPIASPIGNVLGALAMAPAGGMAAKGIGAGVKMIPGAAAAAEGINSAQQAAKALPYVGKAMPFLGNVGEAATTGAGYGAAMNPEIEPDALNPNKELIARLENAKTGAKWGAGLSAAGQGLKSGINKYLSMTSGVPEKAVSGYVANQPEVDNLVANEGGADYATKIHNDLQNAFFAKKKEIGQNLAKQIGGAENLTDTDKIFAPIEDHITKLVNSEMSKTAAGQAEIQALRDHVEALRGGLPDQIKPETVWDLKDRLYRASQVPYNGTNAEKQVAAISGKAYNVAKQELNNAANTAGINKEYSKYADLQDKMDKYFGDPDKTYKTLQGIDAPSKEFARDTARQIKQNLGVDLQKPSEILSAYRYFRNPEMMPVSSGGTTSTTRSAGMSGAGAVLGGFLGGPAGAAVGAAGGAAAHSPAATKQYIKIGNAVTPYAQQLGPSAGQIPYVMSPWLKMKEKQ